VGRKAGLLVGAAANALVLAALGTGCLFGDEPEEPPEVPAMTEPKYVLANVEHAFNERDKALLGDCLQGDFTFYFDPGDVGQNAPGSEYRIPESWSKAEFMAACRNIFDKAYTISLSIPRDKIGKPKEGVTYFLVEKNPLDILVMVDELNGYQANQGYCDFGFGQQANGEWRMANWHDYTGAHNADEPATLGKILALYH
jgi:hypothetical protein